MSIGVQGPIRDIAAYAIARTFHRIDGMYNAKAASCKSCGVNVQKGLGIQMWVSSLRIGQIERVYVCRACFLEIAKAHEKFPAQSWVEHGLPTVRELERDC